MQEVVATRNQTKKSLIEMHQERSKNDEWCQLINLQAEMEKDNIRKTRAQHDGIIAQLRHENDMLSKAKVLRDLNLRSLDHSIDKDGAIDPKNVNLLPFMDESRVQVRK